MNQIARLAISALTGLTLATALHANNWSVFSFTGSNTVETIQGVLVLNSDAVRASTATGYIFETPVDFLHYTVSDLSGVLASFTLTADHPNTLTITKGADGSTWFFLLVDHVPTDPPSPVPPAFVMEFSYSGGAPWGDSVPDRTIDDATDVILGADDLYTESVSIVEVTMGELSRQLGAINAERGKLKKHLANGSKD